LGTRQPGFFAAQHDLLVAGCTAPGDPQQLVSLAERPEQNGLCVPSGQMQSANGTPAINVMAAVIQI
jgi:hypothetical protein